MQRPTIDGFHILAHLPVVWGEMDAFGHVNNVVYFRYFETARIAYFQEIGLLDHMERTGVGPILAETRCRFRRPLSFPDSLRLGVRVTSIARDGFQMAYRVYSDALDTHAAEGDGRIVIFDYKAGRKAELPLEIQERIEALEAQ